MNESQIIEKLLRGETLSETEIGLFLVDTSNSERVHEEVFKRRGNVSHIRTVKRIRGKLYETLWERTATDCAYPKQPYEIKDSPYWQALTNKAKIDGNNTTKASPKPALYLYLLSQDENSGYDTYDSCIVCAESEDEAKRIYPDEYCIWDESKNGWIWRNPVDPDARCCVTDWATRIENIHCKLIGTAADGIEKGVVIASFNAG